MASPQFMYCNLGRPHKSLVKAYPRTPAMAAGVADHIWTWDEIAGLLLTRLSSVAQHSSRSGKTLELRI
jgi:hypothetical protein